MNKAKKKLKNKTEKKKRNTHKMWVCTETGNNKQISNQQQGVVKWEPVKERRNIKKLKAKNKRQKKNLNIKLMNIIKI